MPSDLCYLEGNDRDDYLFDMKICQEFAKENNCIGVQLDTWNFQAPEFYKKLGYIVWGEFKDCPPGTTHYYLYKKF